tara:strand:+ start:7333 stop:8406 length:1074 start_codon:yes stop_codon:yes gene_type:complete
MAIFGTIDGKAFANTVAVTQTDATVTKNAADAVAEGDVLEIDGVNYIVRTVASTTSIELHKAYAGSTNNSLAASKVIRRTPPKAVAEYVIKGGDSTTSTTELLFLDATEASLSENKSRGLSGGGWWSYRTYVDVSGRTRHKTELLAAVSAAASASVGDTEDVITADATSAITISSQPASATTFFPAGAVGTFTSNGAADGSRTAGTYTVTNAAGNASGTGADFTVVVAANGTPTVTLVSGGTGYANSETITIADSALGGGGGASVVLTVTAATAAHTFSVTASSTGSSPTITYQWQRRTSSSARWANISSGGSSQTLALTSLTSTSNGYQYRVKVNNSIGGKEVTSSTATLTVTDNT